MKIIDRKALVVIVSVLALLVGHSVSVPAQTTSSGNITGQVKDPQGASVPGANVSLYNRERTFSLSTTTDSSGSYHFEKLGPGEYLIEAEAQGLASAPRNR
jgi:hypothetical protein